MIYGFAAAVVGGVDSPPGAIWGGLVLRIGENLLGAYVTGNERKLTIALVPMFAILVIRPQGLLGGKAIQLVGAHSQSSTPSVRPLRLPVVPATTWVAVLAVASASVALLLPSYWAFKLSSVLILALTVGGLQLPIGSSGQISLGHGAFFAVGAYTAGVLLAHQRLPFYVTVPAAMAICGLFGFLFGLPAPRLSSPISRWPPSHSLSRCRSF